MTAETLERALAITNTIASAAKARGFSTRDDAKDGRITLVGHATEVQFRITEQLETRTRKSRWSFKEMENYKVPTGRLRLTISNGWHEGKSLEDKSGAPLETRLNRFFEAVYKQVVKQWQSARADEVRRQLYQQQERERQERARIREAQERVAAEERARRRKLASESLRWIKAERIRTYIAHLRQRGGLSDLNEKGAWIKWALRVAEDLDPTDGRLASILESPEP